MHLLRLSNSVLQGTVVLVSDLKVLPNHHGALVRIILWENFMIEMKYIFKIMYNGVFPHSAACVSCNWSPVLWLGECFNTGSKNA